MKQNRNIHILPTDKPSRLYLGNNGNFVFGMIQTSIQSRNDDFTNQNIYITNDEEIKEGTWSMSLCDDESYEEIYQCKKANLVPIEDRKIILTTDPRLAPDVQRIDDEFLEWFVTHPSCENVEVSYELLNPFQTIEKGYVLRLPDNDVLEEPKQETTLEEVLGSSMCQFSVIENKLAILYRNQVKIYDAVTKEQQSYSEEEVIDLLYKRSIYQDHFESDAEVREWFNKFKNK